MGIGRLKGVEDSADSPAKENVQRLRQQLDSYMAQQGLRSTGQRRIIVDQFFRTKGHVTIDDLLEQVRLEDSGIGYATVYRTMKMLASGGIANEHKFTDGMTRYELADEDTHHDHLICMECGRIQEFEEPLIEQLQERIATQYKFRIVEHKHELYGVCAQCTSPQAGKPQSDGKPQSGSKPPPSSRASREAQHSREPQSTKTPIGDK